MGYKAFLDTAWFENQPDGMVYIGKAAYKYKGETPPNTELILKDDTRVIAEDAFCEEYEENTGLVSIKIPDSVISIGSRAFQNCVNLTDINIPAGVTNICDEAFYNSYLSSADIPESVESIGNYAFGLCRNLKSITIRNPECQIFDDDSVINNDFDDEKLEFVFNGTIYGYENSTAQTYAEKYEKGFVR